MRVKIGTVSSLNPLKVQLVAGDTEIPVVPTSGMCGIVVGDKLVLEPFGDENGDSNFIAMNKLGNDALSKCILIKPAAQSIPNSTVTKVEFSSSHVDYDPLGLFDDSNDRIDIPSDGIYHIAAGGRFASNATGERAFYIRVNGSYVTSVRVGAGGNTGECTVVNLNLSKDDYVDFSVYQSSGGALNFGGADAETVTFSVIKV